MRPSHKLPNSFRHCITSTRKIVLLSVLVACTESIGGPKPSVPPGGITSPTPMLTTLSVSLSATTARIGQSAKATAAGKDQYGSQFAPGVVTWTTVPDGIATIASDGTVTGIAEGIVTVWASKAGVQPGSASITFSR